MLAYAAAALVGRWSMYLSFPWENLTRGFERAYSLISMAGDAVGDSLFPVVVLVVLLRFVPPPADVGERGFAVMSPSFTLSSGRSSWSGGPQLVQTPWSSRPNKLPDAV